MKVLFIVLTILLFGSKEKITTQAEPGFSLVNMQCPEQEPFDWGAIHMLLIENRFEKQREMLGIPVSKANNSDLWEIKNTVTQHPPQNQAEIDSYWHSLGGYWSENGVNYISDNQICENILKALKTSQKKPDMDRYSPRAFYKINNRYLVMYKSSVPGTGLTPIRILNQNFEIIDIFGM